MVLLAADLDLDLDLDLHLDQRLILDLDLDLDLLPSPGHAPPLHGPPRDLTTTSLVD